MMSRLYTCILILTFLALSTVAYGQFSSSLQGFVQDPSGASIPQAEITLTNLETQVTTTTKTDASGNYQFLSLPPGKYQLAVDAKGFNRAAVDVSLLTAQPMNVPITLSIQKEAQAVTVTSSAPVLDTGDSRSEMTLTDTPLSTLPLAGRNMINLVAMAPGVEGLGTMASGGPTSTLDNFNPELQIDASANGRSSVGNMFIIDGLDITSNVRNGVLNVTPNPDAIQEASVQTNTFSVEYGRVSSIQMVMTTKSGTNQFHGNASDYFTYQSLWAGTEFSHTYSPFHSNNMSGAIGGPISRSHHAYFFFAIEPLRSSASAGGTLQTWEDPQFVAWATQNFPNNLVLLR